MVSWYICSGRHTELRLLHMLNHVITNASKNITIVTDSNSMVGNWTR